jgi:hypothetical protein
MESDDILPPADWSPKSRFFQAAWAKVQFNLQHRRWSLQCPKCGHYVELEVKVEEIPKMKVG